MPSLGMAEIIVIAIAALVLLGPDKLPKAARSVGKALNELRRHSDRVKDEFRDVVDFDEITAVHRDITSMRDDVRSSLTSAASAVVGTDDVPKAAADDATIDDKSAPGPGMPMPAAPADAATADFATAPAPTSSRSARPVIVEAADLIDGDGSAGVPATSTKSSPLLDSAAVVDDAPSRRIPGVAAASADNDAPTGTGAP